MEKRKREDPPGEVFVTPVEIPPAITVPPIIPPERLELRIPEALVKDLASAIGDYVRRAVSPRFDLIEDLLGAKSFPVARVGSWSGTSTSYKEVVSWNVGGVWNAVTSVSKGELLEVSMTSDNFEKTVFRLSVYRSSVDRWIRLFEDSVIQAPLTVSLSKNVLFFGDRVLLEARSLDGTLVRVNGSICGREW